MTMIELGLRGGMPEFNSVARLASMSPGPLVDQ